MENPSTSKATSEKEEVLIAIPQEALPAVQAALHGFPPPTNKRAQRRPRASRIPAIRQGDQTPLPSIDQFRAITQSFSTAVEKPSRFWKEGTPIELITPAGILTVQGESNTENATLQEYVSRHLGPNGLKHLIAFFDVYVLLTGGIDPNKNIQVTAKQLLDRVGLGAHASDSDEQLFLLESAKYFSSVWFSLSSSKRYAPLIVIESANTDPREGISFVYHLGIEFYEAVFGPKPRYYVFPTSSVLSYHGKYHEPELNLSFHISDHIAENGGHYSVYFVNLCLQAPLMSLNEIQYGGNRTRKALRIVLALERLQRDQVFVRAAHPDVDLVLAVSVCLDEKIKDQIAPETLCRIGDLIAALRREAKKDGEKVIVAKRRVALQNLLNVEASDERVLYEHVKKLSFSAGPLLLKKQKELNKGEHA